MFGRVEYPQNELTRLIEQTAAENRSGLHGGGVASATPLPSVQSADFGRVLPADAPLTEEERAELNRKAVEAGIHDERLGVPAPASAYESLGAAVAAGAQVTVPTERMIPKRSTPTVVPRDSARLPDFRKVEGIDLLRSRVWIDGMEFPITEEDARGFKEFVVETARAAIMVALSEAISLFTQAETPEDLDEGDGMAEDAAEEVQRQPEGSSPKP